MRVGSPGFLQRLIALAEGFDGRRLRIAFDVLLRAGPRVLWGQLMVHSAFRWRLRQLGADEAVESTIPPVEEHGGPVEFYHEGIWPDNLPLVSVIIPCFNYGIFVAQAVDSVLTQTFSNLEIIVVEGGSTDPESRDIVASLRRPKTQTLFRDVPCPVGDNRNFGIHHARGKYICCLDADDMLEPTYLEKALFLLETEGCDLVSTSVKRFGALQGGYSVMPAPDLSHMLEGNHVSTCAVFRRSKWEEAGGFVDTAPDQQFVHEDWRFWVRLAALGARIKNISGEQLFRYRAHQHLSLSNRSHLLSNREQVPLVRDLNKDVVTPDALRRSRMRAKQRLRSIEGTLNLVRHVEPGASVRTILLAVPHLVLGGAERLLSEVVSGLNKAGFRVVIVTTISTWAGFGDTTSWFEPSTNEIYHLPRFLPQSRWFDFVEYLIRSKGVAAILLAGSTYFYNILRQIKSRFPHLRIGDLLFNSVAHVHGNREVAAMLDVTLVEGDDVRNWLLSRGETPDRISLIPSGIDLERYRLQAQTVEMTSCLSGLRAPFIAGFSGRLAEEKAPMAFVKIANLVAVSSPVRFVMTGAGPLEDKVRAALKDTALLERFDFAGMVADIRNSLCQYSVLVLPSILDGRPTVVMEALAMGVPVIASNVGSLPAMVIHGQTGFLCEPQDLRAFAEHIQWLCDHPRDHARMSIAARDFAEANFNVQEMVAGYVGVFERLIGRGPSKILPSHAEVTNGV